MNNTCSTDFYNECMRDNFPYKVIWNNYQPTFGRDGSQQLYYPPKVEDEKIESRFDLLDIPPKKIKTEGLTIEKIQKRFDKMQKEIDGNTVWKDPKPDYIRLSFSEYGLYLQKAIEKDIKKCLEESMRKFKEKTQITNRWEILDL